MRDALEILSVVLAALAMVPALAHALELPGKLRLTKEAYLAVQPIYYPGFTIAAVSEPLAILAAAALTAVTPRGSADFWFTLAALLGLLAMHAVYWTVTHPVNKFWLQGEKLSRVGARFFSTRRDAGAADWTKLRDRWEYSHAARAALAFASFVALVTAACGRS